MNQKHLNGAFSESQENEFKMLVVERLEKREKGVICSC